MAVRQAQLTGARIQAVIAWQLPTGYAWGPVIDDVDWAGNAREALETTIKQTVAEQDAAPIERVVAEGHPALVLARAGEGADVLVMGSRGHGGFTGMLVGSVSQHVVAHATCPVLVVHVDAQA